MANPITPERRRQLAEKHGVNEQYLYQCLTGRRDMGPAEAMRLETETEKELTRQMLCQKTYAGIWPELVPSQGSQPEDRPLPKVDSPLTTDPALAAEMIKAEQAGIVKLSKQPIPWSKEERRIAREQRRAIDRANDAALKALKGAGKGG